MTESKIQTKAKSWSARYSNLLEMKMPSKTMSGEQGFIAGAVWYRSKAIAKINEIKEMPPNEQLTELVKFVFESV